MKTGLTSVTFRKKTVEEIIECTKKAGLKGVEWGGDVHVPCGEINTAHKVRKMTLEAGLEILSYGSYFKALDEDFSVVLDTAVALGAPIIRVWAGNETPSNISDNSFELLVSRLQSAGELAKKAGVVIALEYHRGTMTETIEGALKLLEAVNSDAVKTYWQPNPEISVDEHLVEIEKLREYIVGIHVFNWLQDGTRCLLEEGEKTWKKYLGKIEGIYPNLILEFVKKEEDNNFYQDAVTLIRLNDSTLKKAIFLCGGDRIHSVYNNEIREILNTRFALSDEVITEQKLFEKMGEFSEVEYVFSTWGMLKISEKDIKEYLPSLKAVFYGAGSVQGFAKEFLNCGVRVFSSWGANAIPVAENTIAHILLANKGFHQCLDKHRKKDRHASHEFSCSHPGNYDTKVGILGAGMIGRKVMEFLNNFRLDILVYDPFVSEDVLNTYGAKRADLETVFADCQVISNHLANLPATVGILDYKLFSKMKDNATFINTGRGAQVVEDDLILAMQQCPNRTAVLDVTFPEPPKPDSLLWDLPNVFMTPHIAGSKNNELARMGEYMQLEAFRLLEGEENIYEVVLEMLKTMA